MFEPFGASSALMTALVATSTTSHRDGHDRTYDGTLRAYNRDDGTEAWEGQLRARFANTETMGHNFAIRIDGEVIDRTNIISDEVVELTELEPGEYEFICEPHVNLGMSGTLIVTD